VEFLAYEPERVRVQVRTQSPGLLVLADTWMPGWQATVDGSTTPIYVANHAFRAVAVAAGDHQVEFVYAPASVRAGLVISGAAAIGCAVWIVVGLLRRANR
jgi:uncharacterized membrane protein YfhO